MENTEKRNANGGIIQISEAVVYSKHKMGGIDSID